MAKYQDRLDRLEQVMEEDNGGVFIVYMEDGQSEEEALRDAMAKAGLTKRPRCPICVSFVEAQL